MSTRCAVARPVDMVVAWKPFHSLELMRMAKHKPKHGDPLFWNRWGTDGGPGFNGSIEIFRRGKSFFTVLTNLALSPAVTEYGPFKSLEDALACEDASADYVGGGTYEVGSSVLDGNQLLRLLKVYIPEGCEDDEWDLTINGKPAHGSVRGLEIG
jgi:hypothetical protein